MDEKITNAAQSAVDAFRAAVVTAAGLSHTLGDKEIVDAIKTLTFRSGMCGVLEAQLTTAQAENAGLQGFVTAAQRLSPADVEAIKNVIVTDCRPEFLAEAHAELVANPTEEMIAAAREVVREEIRLAEEAEKVAEKPVDEKLDDLDGGMTEVVGEVVRG